MPSPATTHTTYHLFSLPAELLAALRLRIDHQPTRLEPEEVPKADNTVSQTENQGGLACNVCLNATFADVNDQRAHFRSDWHRYNVKVRMNGGHAVDEVRFSQLVEALDDSLSGSASSSSEDEASESDDRVTELIQRTRSSNIRSSRSPSPDNTRGQLRSALVWFHSPPTTQLGVYRSIFSTSASPLNYITELRDAQLGHGPQGRIWAVFMVAGGHFAGAIFRVSKTDEDLEAEREEMELNNGTVMNGEGRRKKKKAKPPKPEIEVLRHKTFHRYTTRRKQGGSQSVNDNAKSKAKSAGAQLRRYGEQALRDDIQNLLKEWVDDLNECERIWFRASWSNRRMFMSDNEGIFEKGDERIRTFPFPTRRPTQSEAIRCVNELLRVKVTHFTEAELQEQDDAYAASLPKPKPAAPPSGTLTPKPQPTMPSRPDLTPEQTSLRTKWLRALDMIERGKLDPLKGFVEKEADAIGGIDGRVPAWMGQLAGGDENEEQARGCNLLMLATIAKQDDIVRWLLEEAGADPTLDVPMSTTSSQLSETDTQYVPEEGGVEPSANKRRTAYDLARTLEVRNTFRRAAGSMPDRWDWLGRGRVPSILTAEMEAGRDEKKKARRKGLKDKIREREAAATPSREPSPPSVSPVVTSSPRDKDATGPRRLGGGGSGSGEGVMGLTPEMRAKVERERRARAAEARAKTIMG